MNIAKLSVKGSPYIGVFMVMTEKILLVPFGLAKKELKTIKENSDLELIETTLADSSLLGVFAKGKNNSFIVSEFVSDKEIQDLKDKGINLLRLNKVTALGNLIAVNNNYCVLSDKQFKNSQLKEIKDFLKVNIVNTTINGSDLIGSSMVLNDNGFIVNSDIKKKEFILLEKNLKIEGLTSTANYGDKFLGLSVVANNNLAFVGSRTSGTELMRIDEALTK